MYSENQAVQRKTSPAEAEAQAEDDVSFRLPDGNLQGCPGVYPIY